VESGGQWQVSTNGGTLPLWSPHGNELFYRRPDAVIAVSVEAGSGFKWGRPKILFQNKYVGQFDIHPDGRRFLMMKPAAEAPRKIIIVLNWLEELKQRVPLK